MSSARPRRTAAAAALAAGVGTLLAAAPALAQAPAGTVGLDGGETRLHLRPSTAQALAAGGVSVAPVGPARARGARVTFPVTGGAITPAGAQGVVRHSGGLAISAGGRTVRLTDFVVNTRTGGLSARVGGARLGVLDLDARRAAVIRRGAGRASTWLVRVEAALSRRGAAALSAALPGASFRAGTPLGRVDVLTRPAEHLLEGGATTLALAPAAADALAALGVQVGPVAPAGAGARGLSFPVTGQRIAARGFAGTISHSGGIALSAGGTSVELTRFDIEVGPTPRLTALVGGARLPVLDLDLAGARTGVSGRQAVVTGVRASLTPGAAAALNQAFGVTALAGGLELGAARVQARIR